MSLSFRTNSKESNDYFDVQHTVGIAIVAVWGLFVREDQDHS